MELLVVFFETFVFSMFNPSKVSSFSVVKKMHLSNIYEKQIRKIVYFLYIKKLTNHRTPNPVYDCFIGKLPPQNDI